MRASEELRRHVSRLKIVIMPANVQVDVVKNLKKQSIVYALTRELAECTAKYLKNCVEPTSRFIRAGHNDYDRDEYVAEHGSCRCITPDTPHDVREDIIEKFRLGWFPILVRTGADDSHLRAPTVFIFSADRPYPERKAEALMRIAAHANRTVYVFCDNKTPDIYKAFPQLLDGSEDGLSGL